MKLYRNDIQMVLFQICSNGPGPMYIWIEGAKIDVKSENSKNLCLEMHMASSLNTRCVPILADLCKVCSNHGPGGQLFYIQKYRENFSETNHTQLKYLVQSSQRLPSLSKSRCLGQNRPRTGKGGGHLFYIEIYTKKIKNLPVRKLRYLVYSIVQRTSTMFVQIVTLLSNLALEVV